METHVRIAGYLNFGLGVLGIVACLATLILFRGFSGVLLINARAGGSTTTTDGFLTMCAMGYLVVMAIPLIGIGYGLIHYQEWARELGLIVSIFTLIHVPLGTVIGIYTMWVVTSFETEPLFKNPPRKN